MNLKIKNLPARKLYLVALSGGGDSVALALMMKEQGLNIHALHCNFHLRGEESDRDERFVRSFCQEHDIALEVKHFDTISSARRNKTSIEMEARELRYKWFAERASHLGAEAICVAHHKDDQAETLLLNLIRGTGLQGLAAMHPDRTINGLRILRPLLDITKAEILQYLASKGQTYVTDSTNLERDALRNRIRLDVMPLLLELNPNITDCLTRTAYNVRMELDTASEESRYHRWLAPLGFTRSQILDIYAHRPQENKDMHTGCMWHSKTHTILLNRGEWILQEKDKTAQHSNLHLVTAPLPIGSVLSRKDFCNKQQAFIDASCLKGELILRPAKQGDRFRPYGMEHGTKLISDYLTNKKIPLTEKQNQLVAVDSGTGSIVWVVAREIDHRYRVTSDTKQILLLTITYPPKTSLT